MLPVLPALRCCATVVAQSYIRIRIAHSLTCRRLRETPWPQCRTLTSLAIGNSSLRAEALLMCVPALRVLRLNGCLSPSGRTTMPLSVAAAAAACRCLAEVCCPATASRPTATIPLQIGVAS